MPGTLRRVVLGSSWIALSLAVLDLSARALVRRGLFGAIGTDAIEGSTLVAVAAGALLVALARPNRLRVFAAFGLAFAIGVTCQLRLGARLQSDGFYYYAYLRSLWFDHDVNFLNDYRMLGLTDKAHLFEPTSTGHAHSAWTIGPAIVWSPFFGVGHVVASALSGRNPNVAADGTSFPYRQAVCLASLFYGLVGVYCSMRLSARFAPRNLACAAAVLATSGSFMLWYLIKEPSMTHATSMASVAAFTWLWAATLRRRTLGQWMALGCLGGLMSLIRWQNAIYGWLPLCEVVGLTIACARQHDRDGLLRLARGALLGGVAALVAFLPQMLAWKAIYGAYFAVSPVGPQLRWQDPHLVDVLWSSRNGLFAMSPVLLVAVLGLPILIKRDRLVGVALSSSFLMMIYFNSIIQDWWGSAGFGGRRFDGALPLLVVALAVTLDAIRGLLARRPFLPAAVLLGAATLWNVTFAASVRRNVFAGDRQNDFGVVSASQASTLHEWIGHPFSYPANLFFAMKNGVAPAAFDVIAAYRFLNDPERPYGRIDVGAPGDDLFIVDGFFAPEGDGQVGYRWASRRAELMVPLARTTGIRVRLRLHALAYDGAPPQRLTVRVNDIPFGPFAVSSDWHTIEFVTARDAWRTTINRVVLEFARADQPAAHGGSDGRSLAAAIDFLRVDEEGR